MTDTPTTLSLPNTVLLRTVTCSSHRSEGGSTLEIEDLKRKKEGELGLVRRCKTICSQFEALVITWVERLLRLCSIAELAEVM